MCVERVETVGMFDKDPLAVGIASAHGVGIAGPEHGPRERGFDRRADGGAEVYAVVALAVVSAGAREIRVPELLGDRHVLQRPPQYPLPRRRDLRGVDSVLKFRLEVLERLLAACLGGLLVPPTYLKVGFLRLRLGEELGLCFARRVQRALLCRQILLL